MTINKMHREGDARQRSCCEQCAEEENGGNGDRPSASHSKPRNDGSRDIVSCLNDITVSGVYLPNHAIERHPVKAGIQVFQAFK